jgi:hypothetical protein
MKTFTITDEQEEKLNAWLEQKRNERKASGKSLYEGASGGATTFKFTPTSLGLVTVVKYWNEEINLTDYESW